MAIGTLIGGAAQFLMQVPSLFKVGFRFMPALSFTDEGVKHVMRTDDAGDTRHIGGPDKRAGQYVFRLRHRGRHIVAQLCVSPDAVPDRAVRRGGRNGVDSGAFADGKRGQDQDFRNTLSSSMNLVFLMTLPSACGLIVLGEPIIRLLYSHAEHFSESDVPMTAWALAGYSIGLTGYAAIKVLSPAFYALDDAKTPMIIALVFDRGERRRAVIS